MATSDWEDWRSSFVERREDFNSSSSSVVEVELGWEGVCCCGTGVVFRVRHTRKITFC